MISGPGCAADAGSEVAGRSRRGAQVHRAVSNCATWRSAEAARSPAITVGRLLAARVASPLDLIEGAIARHAGRAGLDPEALYRRSGRSSPTIPQASCRKHDALCGDLADSFLLDRPYGTILAPEVIRLVHASSMADESGAGALVDQDCDGQGPAQRISVFRKLGFGKVFRRACAVHRHVVNQKV